MSGSGNLELELTDTLGAGLNDHAVIELASTAGAARYRNSETVQRTLTLTGIACSPAALYRVRVAPSRYRARQIFAPVEEGRTSRRRLMFPVNPGRVRDIQAPAWEALPAPLARLVARPAYETFSAFQKAGILNIAAKAAATQLAGGMSCLDLMERIFEVRQDRLWANALPGLADDVPKTYAFVKQPGVLHPPPAGYARASSYKTRDRYGNLQLTFFRKEGEWVVEADIDEAQGLRHLFEAVRNSLRGPTHPYDVREILIAGQGIDPGYRFLFS